VRPARVQRAALGGAAAIALAAGVTVTWASSGVPRRLTPGRSVEKRAIRAVRIGDPDAERVGLVVGSIHGDERAGLRITRQLRRRHRHDGGMQLWVVDTVNPDGLRAGTRGNARGVDLNRNFGFHWSGSEPRSSGYYAGPRPFSEPESRAVRRLVERIRPQVSIWYHQPWGAVLACHGRPRIASRYAKLSGMRTSCRGRGLTGTAISWERHRLRRPAFVIELGPGKLSARAARLHAWAAVQAVRAARP
jgi:protein MpaA